MPLYGCAGVPTLDQNLAIQHIARRAAGCAVIRAETASATRRDGRPELQVHLGFLRAGATAFRREGHGLRRRLRIAGHPRRQIR